MKIKHAFRIAFSCQVFLLSSSFYLPPSSTEKAVFTPTKDFKWLTEYYVISRTSTTDIWWKATGMTIDTSGLPLANGKRNPCTISEYSLSLYNDYVSGKDPSAKEKFFKQVKWLIDTANYKLIGDDMLGHPYTFTFHDLVPPWYGGLAEAEFISVLVRYYSLTKDKTVLPLIIKTRNFLLTPEEKGGLLSRTPEGNIWIEEYGKSRQERHVLNGFFLTIISLNEYCQLFPGDTEAGKILKECLESVKKSLRYYERQNWVTYNRGDYRLSHNWYMKAKVIELQELYRISKDDFFKHMAMLWGTFPYDKPIGRPPGTCLIDNYNFAVPMVNIDGKLKPITSYVNILNSSSSYVYESNLTFRKDSLRYVTDGNVNTKLEINPMNLGQLPFTLTITFNMDLNFDAITMLTSKNVNNVKFQIPDVNGNFKEVDVISKKKSGDFTIYYIKKTNSRKIKVNIDDFDPGQQIMINEIRLHNTGETTPPENAYFISDVLKSDFDKVNVTFDTTDVEDPVVFYKAAPDKAGLNKTPWTYEKFSKGIKAEMTLNQDRIFQFIVIYKIKSANSSISNIAVN